MKDVCFGGARGGTKSVGLILDYRRYASKYERKAQAAIFRKSYKELEKLVSDGQKVLVEQQGWRYVGGDIMTFTHPRTKAAVRMRHLETVEDARKYAGHELPWQGYDEIGDYPDPAPIDLLMGSMRMGIDDGDSIPTYRRSTCMPGGPGHVWVFDRYRPDQPFVRRTYQPLKSRPDLKIECQFIPSTLEDNPWVDREQYELDMAAIGNEALYQAWRYGRWDQIAGAFFDCWDAETMVVPRSSVVIQPWDVKWISGDWGFTDDCVILWHRMDEHRNVVTYHELKVNGKTPEEMGRLIETTNREMGFGKQRYFPFSHETFGAKRSPRAISHELGAQLMGSDVPHPTPADTDREGGWMLMYQLLKSGMWTITDNCTELVKAIPLLQHDPKNSADIADAPYDHAPDAARYGMKTVLKNVAVPHGTRIDREVQKVLGPVPQMQNLEDAARRIQQVAFLSRRLEAKKRHSPLARRARWA